MRFTIEQRYAATADHVIAAFTDPELYPTLVGLTKIDTPEVLSSSRDGERVHLRLRMRFIAEVSSAVRAVIDPTKVSWVQDEHYDLQARRATVVFQPDTYADRFGCTGGYEFVTDPADPARSIMRTHGDLRVRVLLVGGQVERALVSGLQEHYAEVQPLVQRFLTGR